MRLSRILLAFAGCLALAFAAGLLYRHHREKAALAVHMAPAAPPPTPVHETSALKPPAGSHVAIVEFEDMECPNCGRSNPVLKQAAAQFKIPWIRHDFPLSFHKWSFQAAVNARWFDTQSKPLGDDYRDAVFASQQTIVTPEDLFAFTQKFADAHKVALPFALDPQGNLAAAVRADYDLGMRTGVQHTPTVWIVTDRGRGASYREVSVDLHDLDAMIGQAQADTQ